jgi:cytoskeletal protein CcmA (bactofilin family)
VNGEVRFSEHCSASNITVNGDLRCKTVKCSGVLAIKNNACLIADQVQYSSLVVEPGSQIIAKFEPLQPSDQKVVNLKAAT